MVTDSFKVYIKPEGIYIDIAKDVERRLDTLNDELGRPLLQWKSKKLIRLMKYELEANDRVSCTETNNV